MVHSFVVGAFIENANHVEKHKIQTNDLVLVVGKAEQEQGDCRVFRQAMADQVKAIAPRIAAGETLSSEEEAIIEQGAPIRLSKGSLSHISSVWQHLVVKIPDRDGGSNTIVGAKLKPFRLESSSGDVYVTDGAVDAIETDGRVTISYDAAHNRKMTVSEPWARARLVGTPAQPVLVTMGESCDLLKLLKSMPISTKAGPQLYDPDEASEILVHLGETDQILRSGTLYELPTAAAGPMLKQSVTTLKDAFGALVPSSGAWPSSVAEFKNAYTILANTRISNNASVKFLALAMDEALTRRFLTKSVEITGTPGSIDFTRTSFGAQKEALHAMFVSWGVSEDDITGLGAPGSLDEEELDRAFLRIYRKYNPAVVPSQQQEAPRQQTTVHSQDQQERTNDGVHLLSEQQRREQRAQSGITVHASLPATAPSGEEGMWDTLRQDATALFNRSDKSFSALASLAHDPSMLHQSFIKMNDPSVQRLVRSSSEVTSALQGRGKRARTPRPLRAHTRASQGDDLGRDLWSLPPPSRPRRRQNLPHRASGNARHATGRKLMMAISANGRTQHLRSARQSTPRNARSRPLGRPLRSVSLASVNDRAGFDTFAAMITQVRNALDRGLASACHVEFPTENFLKELRKIRSGRLDRVKLKYIVDEEDNGTREDPLKSISSGTKFRQCSARLLQIVCHAHPTVASDAQEFFRKLDDSGAGMLLATTSSHAPRGHHARPSRTSGWASATYSAASSRSSDNFAALRRPFKPTRSPRRQALRPSKRPSSRRRCSR